MQRVEQRPSDVAVDLAGETMLLLPERAVFWPRRSTLFIADPHWGKAAAFRAAGLPVPETTTRAGLERLTRMVEWSAPDRIIFLGDYLHSSEGRAASTLGALRDWGDRHRGVEQVLVRGNHDRGAGDPPDELRVRCVDPPLLEPPFSLRHHPGSDTDGYVLSGHLHPAVRLTGRGRQRERFPCFWIQPDRAVLPAFGDFTGWADITPSPDDRIHVIADDRVIRLGL